MHFVAYVSVSVKYFATSRSLALTHQMGVRCKNKKLVAVGFGHRLLECLSTTWVDYVVVQLILPNPCPWEKRLSILLSAAVWDYVAPVVVLCVVIHWVFN